MKLQTWSKLTNGGQFLIKKIISEDSIEEVATIHSAFFKKPYYKQRIVLRILIWWCIKRYFKTIFKRD